FTFESLFGRFNAELANDLGNLVNRSLTLLAKYAAQIAPLYTGAIAGLPLHATFETAAATAIDATSQAFEAFAPSRALEAIWKLVREGNGYVDKTAPWQLAKDPSKQAELAHTLHMLASVIGVIGGLLIPVLPTTGRTLRAWVGIGAADRNAWPLANDLVKLVDARQLIDKPTPLFPRLDDKLQTQIFDAMVPPAAVEAAPVAASTPTIEFAEFQKLDLRVGKVLSAVAVPKKDKLLHLQVDLGEAKPRSIVAGIAQAFAVDTLVGKQVIVVANLAPRKMAGLVSEGMILAAGGEQILGLSAIDRDVPPGTPVK
ncbi:MAG TPA: methionine--tRNA ligase subunit beta, partial [Kofleriaceae bacterium]